MNEQQQDQAGDEGPREQQTEQQTRGRKKRPARPHEVDGKCSRCGGRWPCLNCLVNTPPYVRIHNNF